MAFVKRLRGPVIAVLFLLCAGRSYGMVFSLHPVSDDRNTFLEHRLEGRWGNAVSLDLTETVDGEVLEELELTCEFERAGDGYDLVVSVENELQMRFRARLVRIWGENWLEVRPSTDSLLEFLFESRFNPLLVVECYWFFRVEELGPELILSAMDPEWMLERLQTLSRHIGYVHRDYEWFERIYLTSLPHELKPFLARIGRHREALPYGVRLKKITDGDKGKQGKPEQAPREKMP